MTRNKPKEPTERLFAIARADLEALTIKDMGLLYDGVWAAVEAEQAAQRALIHARWRMAKIKAASIADAISLVDFVRTEAVIERHGASDAPYGLGTLSVRLLANALAVLNRMAARPALVA
ncbi:MAG: hypothetical protein H5U13_11455 [Parvibaculum sp.]|nr:hypothetical protein [Parvibaculum sp.]